MENCKNVGLWELEATVLNILHISVLGFVFFFTNFLLEINIYFLKLVLHKLLSLFSHSKVHEFYFQFLPNETSVSINMH